VSDHCRSSDFGVDDHCVGYNWESAGDFLDVGGALANSVNQEQALDDQQHQPFLDIEGGGARRVYRSPRRPRTHRLEAFLEFEGGGAPVNSANQEQDRDEQLEKAFQDADFGRINPVLWPKSFPHADFGCPRMAEMMTSIESSPAYLSEANLRLLMIHLGSDQ
jgi:hypothetical protein